MNSMNLNLLLGLLIAYLIWVFGFRRLLLERTRQAMFSVRHDLFMLAKKGALEFNDPAYRNVERFINANIRFCHKFNLIRFFMIAVLFGGKLPNREEFHKFYNSIESHPDKLISKRLLLIVVHVQLLAMRQILWSFLPTAIAYAFAYVIFRSKDRMGNFAKRHLTKPADSIESVVMSADKAFQI